MRGRSSSRSTGSPGIGDRHTGNGDRPILLMGGAIARETYHVSAYPASYWIDRNGMILAREVGFVPGMEQDLGRKINELLAKPSDAAK